MNAERARIEVDLQPKFQPYGHHTKGYPPLHGKTREPQATTSVTPMLRCGGIPSVVRQSRKVLLFCHDLRLQELLVTENGEFSRLEEAPKAATWPRSMLFSD